MTERSYPFVDGITTDAEFSAMFRQLFPSSVLGYYGSDALRVTADASGLFVTLQPGEGFVRGHYYVNRDPKRLDIDPNTSGAPRIDTVVLHLEYGEVQDITARVVPGSGTGAPALAQTQNGVFQLPICDVLIPASSPTIGPGNITDRRRWWGLEFFRMAGLVIGPTAPDPTAAFLHVRTL